jgi:hypothetical protein
MKAGDLSSLGQVCVNPAIQQAHLLFRKHFPGPEANDAVDHN